MFILFLGLEFLKRYKVGFMASKKYEVQLKDLYLTTDFPLSETGVFIGSGGSKEAGFPLTWELTRDILKVLDPKEIDLIKTIIQEELLSLEIENGHPDIEVINDLVMKSRVQASTQEKLNLENKIKEKILENLKSVTSPDFTLHRALIKSLKKRSFGKSSDFWFFSTNYDLLIEKSCAYENARIENGFSGTTFRFFDIDSLKHSRGFVKQTFHPMQDCTFRLFKLHGSLSWFKEGGKIYEGNLDSLENTLILPSRNKVMDTLHHPFDAIFTAASQVIGSKCKYLICIGHSFRDEHINKHLLIPGLKEGKIKILALIPELNDQAQELAQYPSFDYITSKSARLNGITHEVVSDLWKFSSLIAFLENHF